jgi:hypothetical protein
VLSGRRHRLCRAPAHGETRSVWIDDLTWPEVRDAIAPGLRTAIVYTGSSEQNGPHMVIGKHNFVARSSAISTPKPTPNSRRRCRSADCRAAMRMRREPVDLWTTQQRCPQAPQAQ